LSFLLKFGIFLKILLKLSTSEYIRHLLSIEEYSFSFDELIEQSTKDGIALRSELSRLTDKGEIMNLRHGFYLILPPRYSGLGKLPIQLYAEKLFSFLGRRYYIGLFSAAKFHGAGHQQPQQDYFVIEKPKLNPIKKKNLAIEFVTTSHWPEKNIESGKSDAGVFHLSSPSLTFFDLVHYQTKIGGLNRSLASLEELAEELTEADMDKLLNWYPYKSTLQRVGFLLEELQGKHPISDHIFDRLKTQAFYPVLLYPDKNQRPGSVNNRWKIDLNIPLESDL
jgi:predicted transcriptional regulator of viral defense system